MIFSTEIASEEEAAEVLQYLTQTVCRESQQLDGEVPTSDDRIDTYLQLKDESKIVKHAVPDYEDNENVVLFDVHQFYRAQGEVCCLTMRLQKTKKGFLDVTGKEIIKA